MVAVVSGNGLGLFDTSLTQLGRGFGSSGGVGQNGQSSLVNIANGNLILQDQDETIFTRGLPLSFVRTYNSRGVVTDGTRQVQIGQDGWLNVFERRVSGLTGEANKLNSTVKRTLADGSEVVFAYDTTRAAYVSTVGDGAHDTITWDGTSRWTWTEGSSRQREIYDASGTNGGRLSQIIDGKSGAQYNLNYDGSGRLTSVVSSLTNGDGLYFVYDAVNRLKAINTREAGVSRGQVWYEYDTVGRLSAVITDLTPDAVDSANPNALSGQTGNNAWNYVDRLLNNGRLYRTTYEYMTASASDLRIRTVEQSDGTLVNFDYDASGRVIRSTLGDTNGNDADGVGQTTLYSYGVDAGGITSTTVTDSFNRSWVYRFDTLNKQLREVYAPAVNGVVDVTSYRYDASGNVLEIKVVSGGVTLSQMNYEYDTAGRGNVVKQWDLLGNRIDRTYDLSNEQLLTETLYTAVDPDRMGSANPVDGQALTTRYVYNTATGRLRFSINAANEVTEYLYGTSGGSAGQVTTMRRFVGASYSGTLVAETDVNAWATNAARTAASERTNYVYDAMGRLLEKQSFAAVTSAGVGVLDSATEIVRYSYDPQGLLRQQITQRGANRVLNASTPQTGSEVVDYTYDGMGRLLSVTSSTFGVVASDTTTIQTTYVYTDSGSRIAVTSDAGATRTELRNAAGQVISVSVANAPSSPSISRTTRLFYDAAGQLRGSEDAMLARRYFFYDAKGRLEAEVDATGAVTRYEYDGADRRVRTVSYANRVSTATWLSGETVTKASFADIGVVLDAANDRTSVSTFDVAGRLLTQTDAVSGANRQITTYSYDGAGRVVLIRVTDGLGTAATARVTRNFYDAAGRVEASLDAERYLVRYTYDRAGRVIQTTRYATAIAVPATIDAGTLLSALSITSNAANDQTTRYFYNGRGQSIGSVDALGYLTEAIIDEAGNTRAERRYGQPLTSLTGTETFAALKSLVGVSSYRETKSAYNGLGQLVTQVNAEGTVTRFSYDEAGRLVRTQTAENTSEVRESVRRYNVFDEVIGEMSGEQATQAMASANLGGKFLDDASLTEAQLNAAYAQFGMTHRYDSLSRRTESVDAQGNKTFYFYDAQGRSTFVVKGVEDSDGVRNAAGEVTETRYNAFGQVQDSVSYTGRIVLLVPGDSESAKRATDALSFVTSTDNTRRQFSYDQRGLLRQRLDGVNTRTDYAYNAFGQLQTEINAVGSTAQVTTNYNYDKRGLLTTRTEGVGTASIRSSSQAYDAFGRVITRVDARNVLSTLSYDRLGRELTRSISVIADGVSRSETITRSYDAFDRLLTMRDALGKVTTYVHSDSNRSVTVTTPEGVQITTARNRHGQVVTVTQPLPGGAVATSRTTYDKNGAVIASTNALNQSSGSVYDVRGLLTESTDATGRKVAYTYDAIGRVLTRVEDPAGMALTTRYVYDGQGRQMIVTDAVGRVSTMSYDTEGRLLLMAQDPAGLNVRTQYSYDALGRQITVTEGAGSAQATTTVYGYDVLGRRTSETLASGSLNLLTTYAFDANDNVISKTDASGRVTRYSYDAANRLRFSLDGSGGLTEMVYDAAGRVTMTRTYAKSLNMSGLGAVLSEADVAGQVSAQELTNNALDAVSYRVYDGDGRLRLQVDGTGRVGETLYDTAGRVARETRYAQAVALSSNLIGTLRAGTATVASVGVVASASDGSVRYVRDVAGQVSFKVDGLGNTIQTMYDAAGRVVSDHRYTRPIVVSSTLLAKLDAGTATSADIVAAAAANATTAPWSTGFESRTPAGLDLGGIDPLNNGGARIENGRLVFNRVASGGATGWPTVMSQNPYTLADGLTYRMEISTDATQTNNNLLLSLRNMTAGVNNNEGIHISNGQLSAYRGTPASGHQFTLLGALSDNTTYVVELETTSTSITTYVYAKGQDRSSGFSVSRAVTSAEFGSFKLLMHGTSEPGVSGASLFVDNMAILNTAATVSTSYRYDAAGRLAAKVDGLGNTETYTYDAAGRRLSTTDANGNTSRTVYDAAGRAVFSIDATGAYSRTWYDGVGRAVAQVRFAVPLNRSLLSDATTVAQLDAQLTWPSGNETRYSVYDAAGRMRYTVQLVAPDKAIVSESRYDGAGRVLLQRAFSATMAFNPTLATSLVLGNATDADFASFIAANASTAQSSRTVYDAAGQVIYTSDALGAVTRNWYDGAGRVVATRRFTAPLNPALISDATTWQQLDGMLTWMASDQTSYTVYDAAGQVRYTVQMTAPDMAIVKDVRYDGAGRVLQERSFAASVAIDSAMALKLVLGNATDADFASFTTANASTAQSSRTVYDAAGRAVFSIDATGAYSRTWYDGVGRAVAQVRFAVPLNRSLLSDATTVAQLDAQLTWPSGNETRYSVYDAAGRMRYTVQLVAPDKAIVSESRYDGAGRVLLQRAFSATMAFNPTLATSLVLGNATDADFASFVAANESGARAQTWVYDAAGQARFSLSRDGGQWLVNEQQYDGVGRVTAEVRYGFGIAYTAGQTEAQVVSAIQAQLSADPQVLATQTRRTQYVYDAAGQQRFVLDATGALSEQRYDAAGRVVETRTYGNRPTGVNPDVSSLSAWGQAQLSANVRKVSNTYDAAGNLLARTDGLNQSERFTYDGLGQTLTRTDRMGAVWSYQYDAAGRRIAEISPASDVFSIDAQGMLTAKNRTIVTRYSYDGLGNVLRKTEDADFGSARVTQYVYDALGYRIKTILPHPGEIDRVTGNLVYIGPAPTIEITYNALGQAVVQKDERGNYSYKAYNVLGQLSLEMDQERNVTAYSYNTYGEQTRLVRYAAVLNTQASAFTSVNWQAGQAISESQMQAGVDNANAGNRFVLSSYDMLGRKTEVVQSAVVYYTPGGIASTGTPMTRFSYNAYGEAVKESVLLSGTAGQADAIWADTWRYYDAAGRNVVTVDAEGYVTAMTYNATGEVVRTVEYARSIATAGLGTQTPPALPVAGDLVTGYDRETRWGFDVLGRQVTQTVVRNYRNTDGSSAQHDYLTRYDYDAEDRMTAITDNTGTITTTYNALGQKVAVREQLRSVLVTDAEALLQQSGTTGLGSALLYQQRSPYTTIAYDGFGRLVASRRHANGHDGVNPPATSANDQINLTFYDTLDRALMSQDALGNKTYSAYDESGHMTHSWSRLKGSDDSRDVMVDRWYTYDKAGRQLSSQQMRQSLGGVLLGVDQSEAVQYNAFGEITGKTYEGLSGQLQYGYDGAGRLSWNNESGAIRSFGYNLAGHQVREWHKVKPSASEAAVEVSTWTQTDRLGRAVRVTQPSYTSNASQTSQVSQRFDRWGNVVQVVDARGNQTDYLYNDSNQLIRETRALAWVVGENGAGSWQRPVKEWYYDAGGYLRGTRDANGNLRTYDYDAVGRQTSATDGVKNTTLQAYDVFGNQRLSQNALGYITFKGYDLNDRVTSVGDYLPQGAGRSRNTLQSYVLNQAGDRVQVTNALNATTRYDYDSQQRLLRSQSAMGVVMQYGYDVQGHKVSEINGLAGTATYSDREGESVQLHAQSWNYDVFGRVIDYNNLSGRDSDYVYDAESGMLLQESSVGGVGLGANVGAGIKNISYYLNGQIRQIEQVGGGTYRYEYDAAGNRTREEVNTTDSEGKVIRLLTLTTYDSHNRVLRVTQDDQAVAKRIFDLRYDYDAAGNRRRVEAQSAYGANVTGITVEGTTPPPAGSIPVGVSTEWYTYDAENRIQISGGVLSGAAGAVGTTIVLAPVSVNSDAYRITYDAAGNVVARFALLYNGPASSALNTVYVTSYDLRGNRQYEYHMQILGFADGGGGVAKQFFYDEANQLIETRSYYERGRMMDTPRTDDGVVQTRDVGGWLSSAEQMRYDADGRLRWQASRVRTGNTVPYVMSADKEAQQLIDITVLDVGSRIDYSESDGSQAWSDANPDDNASAYDSAGRVKSYRYSGKAPDGSWYTHTFKSEYGGWGSYQEQTVSGISSNTLYKPSTNTLIYDAFGRVIKQQERTEYQNGAIDDRLRVYSYNAEGQVQSRREGSWKKTNNVYGFAEGDANVLGSRPNYGYVYSGGQQVAMLAEGGKTQIGVAVSGASLNGNGEYGAGGGMVTALAGEDLRGLAQRVYGNQSLWYVLADANGLSDPDKDLTAGMQLKSPSVSVSSNDAGSFAPYNASEAIGPTSPSLPYIPPPPSAGCNALAMVIMAVIAIAVTIATAGAAAGPLGAAAGTTGTSVLAGTALTTSGAALGAGATMGAAFVGGVAGSVASQAVGSMMGVTSFSWRNALASGVTSAITAGIGMPGVLPQMSKIAGGAVRAALGTATNYAANKLVGNNVSFSWRSVAASAVSGGISAAITPGLVGGIPNLGAQDFLASAVGSVVNYGVRKAFGFKERFDVGGAIADGVSSMISGAMSRKDAAVSTKKLEVVRNSLEATQQEQLVQLPSILQQNLLGDMASGATYDDAYARSKGQKELLSSVAGALLAMGESELEETAYDRKGVEILKDRMSAGALSAFNKAYVQTKGSENTRYVNALGVAQLVEMRVVLDDFIDMLPATSVAPEDVQAEYQKLRRTLTAGMLAKDVYFDASISELMPRNVSRITDAAGLAKVGLSRQMLDRNAESGYFGAVYLDSKNNEYYLANRGTEIAAPALLEPDAITNLYQSAGEFAKSAQYTHAVKLAKRIEAAGIKNITFVGHSLGGGLAAAQALLNRRHAITFNASGLHNKTLREINSNRTAALGLIENYVVDGEILDYVQRDGKKLAPFAWSEIAAAKFLSRHPKVPLSPDLRNAIDHLSPEKIYNLPEAVGKRVLLSAAIPKEGWSGKEYGSFSLIKDQNIGVSDALFSSYYNKGPISQSKQMMATSGERHGMTNVLYSLFNYFKPGTELKGIVSNIPRWLGK